MSPFGHLETTAVLFCFLLMDIQLLQHHLLRRLSLLHCISFAPLSKTHICVGQLLSTLFCSSDLRGYFDADTTLS